MKRRITFRAACWLFVGMALAMCKQPSATEGKTEAVADTMTVETPEDAIAKLMAGNARYVEGKSDSLDAAIRLHTRVQAERIMANPAIAEKIKEGKLAVKSAYYNIHTGKVVID